MKKKIIHAWNTAGIGGLLARYMDRYYGYESVVYARKNYDPFVLRNEKVRALEGGTAGFISRVVWEARNFDITHTHDSIGLFRALRKSYPDKRHVLHFHGSSIRGKWEDLKSDWSEADLVLVSTPDLFRTAPKNVIYLPNVINETKIYHIKGAGISRIEDQAFHVNLGAYDLAKKYAKQNKLKLFTHDRHSNPMRHDIFLRHLASYGYYIDVKAFKGKILRAFSLTGLEALDLGLKVIDHSGDIHEGLPEVHNSKNVSDQLNMLYRSL